MDQKNLAVLMRLKNAMEMASPSPIPTPYIQPEQRQSKTGWLIRNCRFCKTTKVSYRADWVNPPIMWEGAGTSVKPGINLGKVTPFILIRWCSTEVHRAQGGINNVHETI